MAIFGVENNDGARWRSQQWYWWWTTTTTKRRTESPLWFPLPFPNRLYLYLHFICEWQRRLMLLLLEASCCYTLPYMHTSRQSMDKKKERKKFLTLVECKATTYKYTRDCVGKFQALKTEKDTVRKWIGTVGIGKSSTV